MSFNALYTGSMGLLANSTTLDIVGNNLANNNTTAFKGQRVSFKDMVYQTLNPGSGPSATNGGQNPSQYGFGVGVGSVGSNLAQGRVNATGRNLDMAIQGEGFFQVSDGTNKLYTRAGSFDVDGSGFLIDPISGYRVQRYLNLGEATATTPAFQTPGNQNIKIPYGTSVPGTITQNVTYQGNLSASLTVGQSFSTSIQAYDSQSNPHALTLNFTKTAANTFSMTASGTGIGTATLSSTTVTFDSTGLLASPATLSVALSGGTLPAAQTVNLNLGTVGGTDGLTQFGGNSTASATTQDGRASGSLASISVDSTGVIQGVFTNGTTLPLAQMAIATFTNPGGLSRQGTNYYQISASSGEASLGVGGSGSRGSIQGGALEGSNIDVAAEFSRLIIAQRGYEINSKTITAANEMLQTLSALVR
jgi:flagellar hook protein FlgE